MSLQESRSNVFLNSMRRLLLFFVVTLTLSGTALAAISYTLSTISNPSPIYTGDSVTVSFSITNNNLWYNGVCAANVDSGSWSSESVVQNGATISFSLTVYAPVWGNGAGTASHTVYSYCKDTNDPTKIYKSTSFRLTYTENPKYIATTAINSAQSSINSAQSNIDNDQTTINDAKNLGGDTSLAESKLSNAKNSMLTAQGKMSSANSFYSSSNYEQATNTANDAKSYANSAKSEADSSYSLAIQVKQIQQAAKDSAQAAKDSAKRIIDSVNSPKAEAQNAVNAAKNIGADVGQAQAFLDTAISKLDLANTKYSEANSYFTNLKWSDAKSSANQAESNANEALTNIVTAKSTAKAAADKAIADKAAADKAIADKAIADAKEQTLTKSKLDAAQTSYDSVVDTINLTKKAITLLSNIGVDASEFTKNINDVSSTIVDAKAELNKAKSRYGTKELSESRTYSENSLDITEKELTILDENAKKMSLALMDKFASDYSSANDSYYVAIKSLNESKAKITGEDYASKNEKLDKAKKSLDIASNLISNLLNTSMDDRYGNIIDAFSELQKSKSLSEEIVSKSSTSAIPSFEAIFALTGVLTTYLIINLRRKRF